MEILLQGPGPWDLEGNVVQDHGAEMASCHDERDSRDVPLVHTPGHTRGHVCLLFAPEKVLFSGTFPITG